MKFVIAISGSSIKLTYVIIVLKILHCWHLVANTWSSLCLARNILRKKVEYTAQQAQTISNGITQMACNNRIQQIPVIYILNFV